MVFKSAQQFNWFGVFLENDNTDLRLIFFRRFSREHLAITTCIEKNYTIPF